MFYISTYCTLGGFVAGVKLYPPISLDADFRLSQEGNELGQIFFLNLNLQSACRLCGIFGGFSGTDVCVVWFDSEIANIRTAGKNTVLKTR